MSRAVLLLLAACTAPPADPAPPAGAGRTGSASGDTGGEPPTLEDEDDGSGADEDDGPADPEDDTGAGTSLLGAALDPPLPPPAFAVQAADGTLRTPDWFTGDPSVIWFFRDTGAT